ncbi:hypothetical protein DM860_002862 [Cuscuta australis]|uniref:P-loop containing nucleoside triphosphate hydrolase protein n=1 Tax=Cuscuta australis TaxID=267555 RepID=A0A328D4L7_9ASTE|nr:hypothetical protein DM860_002862 [Cuscuta australis]
MDTQKPETKPIIIAMKGHPGTGKTTLSRSLARLLKLPLLDKDHFRDCTQAIQLALLSHSTPAAAADLLNELSYEAMWTVAQAQLDLGLGVILDSPLSNRARLDRLLGLATRFGARVAVVECRPKDEAEWRRRVEARAGSSWHKPSTWQDIECLMERYGGCWDYDVGDDDVVSMVVDTTAPFVAKDLSFAGLHGAP